MAEVQVRFSAILSDEHLPVLERAHGARVHVDVRVQLDVGDFDAARFEDRCEGGSGDPLAERGHYTASYEYVFSHPGDESLESQSLPFFRSRLKY